MERIFVDTELWVKESEDSNLLTCKGMRKVKDVYSDVVANLKKKGIYDEMDYFKITFNYDLHSDNEGNTFPDYKWISCYVVKGDSEGHYIHVDAIGDNIPNGRVMVMIGKTFEGLEHALKVSNILTEILCEW